MRRLGLAFVAVLAACTDPSSPPPADDSPAPPTPMVSSHPEPAGGNCTYGGTAVQAGFDLDGNGVLEDWEVTSTTYACKAAPNEVVSTSPEAPGLNCSYGGTEIQHGLDANGNGALDPAEVSSTTYACNTDPPGRKIVGDVAIHGQDDVNALAGVYEITGNLTIDTDLQDVALPDLIVVEGRIEASIASSNSYLEFHNLLKAEAINFPSAGAFDLENLQSAMVTIQDIKQESVWFPHLASGYIAVMGNMLVVELDAFVAGQVQVGGGDPSLGGSARYVYLPMFSSGELTLGGLPELVSVEAPAFASGGVSVTGTGLGSLPLPSWHSGDLLVELNPYLYEVVAPTYQTSSRFIVRNNTDLPTCAVQALAAQSNAENAIISNNYDDSVPCP